MTRIVLLLAGIIGLMSVPTSRAAGFAPWAQSAPAPATYGYTVVNTYPHDPDAFTQGLLYLDGVLYESTGLNGRSSIRRVTLHTGDVQRQRALPDRYFGEGLAVVGSELFQLTWQSGVAFVYDRHTFELLRQFRYSGEGWGLTSDGASLVMSDGSDVLRFLDPATFSELRRLRVTAGGTPVRGLNELELVQGDILANIWTTDRIARIDPTSGNVTAWIELAGLLTPRERQSADVLNGIAYDAAADRLFVTGKLWSKLFEIRLARK